MSLDLKTIIPVIIGAAGVLFGAGGMYVSRGESECKAALAGTEARLEAAAEIRAACEAALGVFTGTATTTEKTP